MQHNVFKNLEYIVLSYVLYDIAHDLSRRTSHFYMKHSSTFVTIQETAISSM